MALPAPVTSSPSGYLTFVPPPDAAPEQLSIETRGLTKRYDEIVAVDSLDLRVRQGEVYGFLGPNGAGKTTTLRMLLGLIAPTSGSISMMGMSPGTPESLAKIGAMIENPAFYPFLSGRDNLHMLAAYTGTPDGRIDEVLEQVDLLDRAGDAFKGYSLGMKQRLGVAAALLKNPPLLILDEPTNGLDPAGMADMRRLIRQLGRDGRTVLLSSHLMNEVEQVCDRVGVIARGRIVAEGTVSDLRGVDRLLVRVDQPLQARELLLPVPNVAGLEISGSVIRLEADPGSVIDAAMAARLLVEGGVAVSELRHDRRSLEQVFLDLTGGH
jgi:ABC-2 type transport system ATP-binding protein